VDTDKEIPKASFGRKTTGGQGVRREAESEGHEEKLQAAVEGSHPNDEPVGPRWKEVEPALWGRRRSYPFHRTKVCAGGGEWKISA